MPLFDRIRDFVKVNMTEKDKYGRLLAEIKEFDQTQQEENTKIQETFDLCQKKIILLTKFIQTYNASAKDIHVEVINTLKKSILAEIRLIKKELELVKDEKSLSKEIVKELSIAEHDKSLITDTATQKNESNLKTVLKNAANEYGHSLKSVMDNLETQYTKIPEDKLKIIDAKEILKLTKKENEELILNLRFDTHKDRITKHEAVSEFIRTTAIKIQEHIQESDKNLEENLQDITEKITNYKKETIPIIRQIMLPEIQEYTPMELLKMLLKKDEETLKYVERIKSALDKSPDTKMKKKIMQEIQDKILTLKERKEAHQEQYYARIDAEKAYKENDQKKLGNLIPKAFPRMSLNQPQSPKLVSRKFLYHGILPFKTEDGKSWYKIDNKGRINHTLLSPEEYVQKILRIKQNGLIASDRNDHSFSDTILKAQYFYDKPNEHYGPVKLKIPTSGYSVFESTPQGYTDYEYQIFAEKIPVHNAEIIIVKKKEDSLIMPVSPYKLKVFLNESQYRSYIDNVMQIMKENGIEHQVQEI